MLTTSFIMIVEKLLQKIIPIDDIRVAVAEKEKEVKETVEKKMRLSEI
ncbi:MAG: hypothetical protein HC906_04160 [Bacteroidales bacterium]|nr:hypothetical protein [Bacteroidales bacterium]